MHCLLALFSAKQYIFIASGEENIKLSTMLIIDAHCHYGKGDGLNGPWDTDAPLKQYEKWVKEAGIHRTVLFSAFHSDYAYANKQVGKKVKQRPNQFYGFAFIHAIRDRGRVFSMVKTAVQQFNFKGIKVHRHDAHLSREICEVARSFQIPVLYDVVGRVETVELFATAYPDVNFIIPHLGSFADDWKAQVSFIPMLERHPNVFTDTSGVRRFDLLEMAVKRAGAKKIIFGSDGPWLHPGVELEKIFALNRSPKETAMMVAGNFLQLIKKARKSPKPMRRQFQKELNYQKIQQEFKDPWLEGLKDPLVL